MFTGDAEGTIRKWDVFSTMNGKLPLTVSQRHGQVDSVTKAGVFLSDWKNTDTPAPSTPAAVTRTPSVNTLTRVDEQPSLLIPTSKPLKTPAKPRSIPPISPVYSLDVHSSALWGLSGLTSGGINLFTIRHEEGHVHHVLRGHTAPVSALSITADEMACVSGSWDRNVVWWDLNTGSKVRYFSGSTAQIAHAVFRPQDTQEMSEGSKDPHVFVAASVDGIVRVWDARQVEPVSVIKSREKCPPWTIDVSWSADGQTLFIPRRNATVDVWDIRTSTYVKTLRLPAISGPVYTIATCPNNRHLICASTDNIRIWDLEHTDPVIPAFQIVPGHHGGVIARIYMDAEMRFMVTVSGSRGWEGRSTRQCLMYTVTSVY
jgi:transcriptional activator SPT8